MPKLDETHPAVLLRVCMHARAVLCRWAANDTRDSVLALDGVALPPLGGNGQGGTLQELDVLADGGTGAGADTRPLP